MVRRILLMAFALIAFALPASAQVASIQLDWTAVGDDGSVGSAASYEMRYRNVAVTGADTLAWWNAASVVTNMPSVLAAGLTQTVTVSQPIPVGQTVAPSFAPGSWYFVLRVSDEVPNVSAFSNVAIKSVVDALPPARVTDLRVR